MNMCEILELDSQMDLFGVQVRVFSWREQIWSCRFFKGN